MEATESKATYIYIYFAIRAIILVREANAHVYHLIRVYSHLVHKLLTVLLECLIV